MLLCQCASSRCSPQWLRLPVPAASPHQLLYGFCWPAYVTPPGAAQDDRAEDEGLDVYRELGPRTARTRGGGGAGEVCVGTAAGSRREWSPLCILRSVCAQGHAKHGLDL